MRHLYAFAASYMFSREIISANELNLETALKDKKKNLQIMSDAINKLNNIETKL